LLYLFRNTGEGLNSIFKLEQLSWSKVTLKA